MKTNWLDSVYTDGSRFFVTPSLPKKGEAVTIKLRMFADAPVVDVILRTRINGGEERLYMERTEEKDGLAYYEKTVLCKEDTLHYQFYLITKECIYYYTQAGISDIMPDETYDFKIVYNYL